MGEREIIRVIVTNKPDVPDPLVGSINDSLAQLGFDDAKVTGTGRIFDVTMEGLTEEEALTRAGEAADRLLAHPLIHNSDAARLDSFPKPREGKSRIH